MSKRHVARALRLGAAVAWVLGLSAPGHAQVAVRLDLSRHPGASIRFGAPRPPRVVAPVAVVPAVPPGSVRYEHYHAVGRPYWGPPRPGVVYRHPYSAAY